ncbi:unnamed protein product, partial [Brachionus calyciflorus]
MNVNSNICELVKNNDLVNFVQKPTRICSNFYKKMNTSKRSSTLIDLFLHNGDLVDETDVVNCLFSDHKFVVANLLLTKPQSYCKSIKCRKLSPSNLLNVLMSIETKDFKTIKNYVTVDDKWNFLKIEILKLLDKFALKRKIVSMGTSCGPSIANLHLAYYEIKYKSL